MSENITLETNNINIPLRKLSDNKQVSHSTISEKHSSEESEEPSFMQIIGDFFEEEENIKELFELRETEENLGEVDFEYAFISKDETFELFNPYLRKTSFFYVQNRESVFNKSNSMKTSSFYLAKESLKINHGDKNNPQNKEQMQSRRISQLQILSKNSKNERIESLAKIQSDIMNRIYKKSEKSYNFIINGQKYQFAEKSWFFFDEKNIFRKKLLTMIKSKLYKRTLLFISVINLIGYILYDYSFREEIEDNIIHSKYNIVSWWIEIICTILFTLDFLIRSIGMGLLFGKGTLLKSFFGCFYLFILIASWLIYFPANNLTTFCFCIRFLRNNRIIIFIEPLKKHMSSFIRCIPAFLKTYLSLISLMIFYSILGLHFLKGLDENRCRLTESPINGVWLADDNIKNFCGEWQCPAETFCKNPSDYNYDIPRNYTEMEFPEFNYGMTNFNNFFNSFFTVLHFIDTIGWTSITFNYWKAINQVASALFFTSVVLFGALIFLNILLATLYEGFVSQESIKNSLEKKLKKQEKQNKKEEVNLADLSIAKTLRGSPTIKKNNMSRKSIEEEGSQDKANKKLISLKEKIQKSSRFKYYIINHTEGARFRRFLLAIVLFDFMVLCLDRYPIPDQEMKFIYFSDFIIFWLFFLELLVRMIAYGPKLFFLSLFNLADFLIVFVNLNLYIYEFETETSYLDNTESGAGAAIRISKLFRIFRLLYYENYFEKLNILTKALFKTLHKIKYFLGFALIIAITFALIGRELFAYKFKIIEPNGSFITPRVNFDNFYNSFIAVILTYYIEDWNITVYEGYISDGSNVVIFYMFMVIIGQMTLAVLLKALILNFFIKAIPKHFFNDNEIKSKTLLFLRSTIQTFKSSKQKNKSISQNFKVPNNKQLTKKRKSEAVVKANNSWKEDKFSFKKSQTSNLNIKNARRSFDIKTLKDPNYKKNSNLFAEGSDQTFSCIVNNLNEEEHDRQPKSPSPIVSPTSPHRRKTAYYIDNGKANKKIFFKILTSKKYQYFMFMVTITSMILQITDSKFDEPDSQKQKAIESIDIVLGVIYMTEFIMNIATYGLILDQNSYLRQDFYNKLDFLNIIITFCDFFVDKYDYRIFQTLKIVRTFRLLKIATKTTEEIQLISKAFFEAFPNLLALCIFFSIFLVIFSVYVTHYLKGSLIKCENYPEHLVIKDKWHCLDVGGDWIDEDIRYNNIIISMLSLFQICSCQGWKVLMEKAIDGKGINLQPVHENYPQRAAFFLIYFFIFNFILINMFVGIIGENIIRNKNKSRGLDKLSDEQREWAIIKANILKLKPKPSKNISEKGFRKIPFILLKNKYVNLLFDGCIIFNLVILMSYHHRQTEESTMTLNILNNIMIAIFTIENLIKLFAYQKHYFHSKKCRYEGIILILIWADIIIKPILNPPEDHIKNSYIIFEAIVKGLQATRIYRIFKRIQSVKQIYDTLFHIFPTLLNMLFLIILILYMYAVVGMDMFAYLKPQSNINGIDMHFRTFPIAFFTLVRVATSETWFLVFSDAARQLQPNFVCEKIENYHDYMEKGTNGCGSYWAYPYFLSFTILFSLIILNLFIAVVLTQYDDEFKAHQSAINKYQLKKIKQEWKKSDPNGDGYINYKDFWRFASKIAALLNIQQSVESKKKFLKLLRIPVYENSKTKVFSYKFHDVIIELSKMSVLVNYGVFNLETEEENNEEPDTDEKIDLPKKTKSFKKTQFLCGDMSSIILISRHIKAWVKKAKKQYDAENPAIDIFDISQAALKLIKRDRSESLNKDMSLNEMNESAKEKEQEGGGVSSHDTERKNLILINKNYNIMNEVTVDETSMISQNRSVDVGSNTQRKLLDEQHVKRRASILKNQRTCQEGNENGNVRKKTQGKKIQFVLE